MKLLCPSPELFSDKLKKKLSIRFRCKFSKMNNTKFNKVCHNYEVILIRFNNTINYKKNTKIKYILCPTTGTEHIANDFFKNKNIKIFLLKNKIKFLKNIRATVEFTIFLILFYLRKAKFSILNTKKFQRSIIQEEIYQKRIGIIGYGRVGKKVYKILSSFNANIKIYEIKKLTKSKKLKFFNLNNLLKTSEIILIHIPLNFKNENFLNSSKLNLIRKGSIIINTSRGNVLDEKYIFFLVKKKKISYFTDVISKKILFNQNKVIKELQKNEKFYYSNHIAGLTKESVEKTDLFIYKNFSKNYKS